MIALVMLFAVVAGAVLQAVFPTWTWMGQAHAPILLGVVLYYALSHSRGAMLQAAIFAGLLQDALGQIQLGYSSFCFCMAGLAVGGFKESVYAREIVTHMMVGALAAGGVTLVLYALLHNADLVAFRPGWALQKTLGSTLLGAVIVPFEFELIETLDRMMGNIESRES